jgi:FkbM family methyltransferase
LNLNKIKQNYKRGKITKQDYIEKIYKTHRHLFEYSHFIKNTDIAKIEISDDSVIMTTRVAAIRMVATEHDRRIIPVEILNFDSYEPDIVNISTSLIKEGATIFDIGANIGWFALNLAKSKNNVRVFAFEPIPKTYGYFLKNMVLNRTHCIKPYNFGFSDTNGKITFYYYPELSGNASLTNLSEKSSVSEILCEVKKLDDFVKEQEINSLDFIKCDVEGGELSVIRGGLKAIRKFKPVLLLELLRKWAAKFGYHPNDVLSLLNKEGYTCYALRDMKLNKVSAITESTIETNFVFFHRKKHHDEIQRVCR